jgi:hypothetical protein
VSKKTKTSSTSNSTVTSTPTNPEWVNKGVQGLQDRITGLLDTADPSSLVPGASSLQTQAFDAASGLANRDPLTAAQATSRGILDVDLEGYQNPYREQVIDTTLTGYDEQAAMKRAQLAAQQAQGQKFSGSGSTIESALFNRGVLQDRAGTEAGLRSDGFDRATGLATSDLNREAETSRFNASAANQMRMAEREAALQDIGVLSGLGATQREIEREKLGAEPELLKLIAALQSSQPYSLFRGETRTGNETSNSTSKTSDPLGTLGSLLGAAGSAASGLGSMGVVFSDKRLKSDVETIGKDRSGRRLVSYRYKGEPENMRRVGHIAQEVRKSDPDAVLKIGDRLAIDYGVLGGV